MKRQTKQQRIDQLERENTQLRRDAELFGERLNEARRRTVPMNYGDKDINFLPIYDCRVFEGGFTSGYISEAQYRLMLRSLLPA